MVRTMSYAGLIPNNDVSMLSQAQAAMGSPSEKTELAALREELRQTKAHLASWHESWKQAKQACDAWKREAEEANSRMRMERESASRRIEEVCVCGWMWE